MAKGWAWKTKDLRRNEKWLTLERARWWIPFTTPTYCYVYLRKDNERRRIVALSFNHFLELLSVLFLSCSSYKLAVLEERVANVVKLVKQIHQAPGHVSQIV